MIMTDNNTPGILSQNEITMICTMLVLSFVFLFLPLLLSRGRKIWDAVTHNKRRRADFGKSLLVFSAFMLMAVWCLRYAVGYYAEVYLIPDDGVQLEWYEEIFNSVAHTLQTFSMDEDYTAYIKNGKEMLAFIFPETEWYQTAYSLYASTLNVVAPIAGGAILLEILASIFPKLMLYISYLAFWKEKIYFSELNEFSLSIAKSIRSDKKWFPLRATVIFSDAYVDDENENSSELYVEAKALGAICVKDDVAHVAKSIFGKKKFYIISESETDNVKALTNLCNEYNFRYLKGGEIYLISQSDLYSLMDKQVIKKLEHLHQKQSRVVKSLEKLIYKTADAWYPNIMPIQIYRNLVCNLLVKVPLYEPLVGKSADCQGKKELNVTILGNGMIGTEMFLAVYWFGQMLDCTLNVNVVSKVTEEQFWKKVDYVNPEIKETVTPGHKILRYSNKATSDPYCNVKFIQSDVQAGEFWKMNTPETQSLLDTDYFMVALGSDETNISIAEKLRLCMGEHHIDGHANDKCVISYVVYDSDLCEMLNLTKCFCSTRSNEPDIYMHAFGALDEVYSTENLLMTDHALRASEVGYVYKSVQQHHDHARQNNGSYNYWADIARAMHLKYKVFSLGMINTSVFDNVQEDKREHERAVVNACAQYRRVCHGKAQNEEDKAAAEKLESVKHRLSWLEHRRWNAFTRVMGYRSTALYRNYVDHTKSYKHMPLKLHPCLVECDDMGIHGLFDADGYVIDNSIFDEGYDKSSFDFLDKLSYSLHELEYTDSDGEKKICLDYDFKMYDYPSYEFDDYKTVKEANAVLGIGEKKIVRMCKKGHLPGVVVHADTGEWLIPGSSVKKLKKKLAAKA